jgi:hypothetical protein
MVIPLEAILYMIGISFGNPQAKKSPRAVYDGILSLTKP